MAPSLAVLDLESLDRLRSLNQPGEADLVEQLASVLLGQLDIGLTTMRSAAERGDWAELAETAHHLRSACHNLGAQQLAALLRELEDLREPGDGVAMRRALAELGPTVDAARSALQAVLKSRP